MLKHDNLADLFFSIGDSKCVQFAEYSINRRVEGFRHLQVNKEERRQVQIVREQEQVRVLHLPCAAGVQEVQQQ